MNNHVRAFKNVQALVVVPLVEELFSGFPKTCDAFNQRSASRTHDNQKPRYLHVLHFFVDITWVSRDGVDIINILTVHNFYIFLILLLFQYFFFLCALLRSRASFFFILREIDFDWKPLGLQFWKINKFVYINIGIIPQTQFLQFQLFLAKGRENISK